MSSPPCFEDVPEFRNCRHTPGDHDLAVDHHGRRSHDAEIQDVGNIRYVRDVRCEIEFGAGVDDIPFRGLAVGAAWRPVVEERGSAVAFRER